MITRLVLTNFQSWEALDLPLSPVVVLVGETNQGKSAILRALYAVLYNGLEGSAFIRKGAKLASVEVHLDSGSVVRLEKGVGINRYVLDGTVFDKIGRGVPAEVQAALGVSPVVFDDTTFLTLQFQAQMDPPFLLADQGVKATRLLGSVSQAAVLYQAARASSAQKKTAMSARTAQDAVVEDAAAQVASYAYVAALEPLADALEDQLLAQEALQARRVRLEVRAELYTRELERLQGLRAMYPRVRARLAGRQALLQLHERRGQLVGAVSARLQAVGTLAGMGEERARRLQRVEHLAALVRRHERLAGLASEREVLRRFTAARSRVAALTYRYGVEQQTVATAIEALYDAEQRYTCPTCGKETE